MPGNDQSSLRYDLFQVLDLLVENIQVVQDREHPSDFNRRTALICTDGFHVSVQMSKYNYNWPRLSGLPASQYESAELGFPNRPDNLITEYADNPELLTDTVYGYVPMSVIQELLLKHGGLNQAETIRLTKIKKQLEDQK
tara:strand:- start:6534 stop:6953 length:420 start_codon:yes stop_codon:yes gene_type:complete